MITLRSDGHFPQFTLVILLLLMCFSSTSWSQVEVAEDADVIYLSFDIDTVRPVTTGDDDGQLSIEDMFDCKFSIRLGVDYGAYRIESDSKKALVSLFSKAQEGQFFDGGVRLKIVGLIGDALYVSLDGSVEIHDAGQRQHLQLDDDAFTYLRALIRAHTQGPGADCSGIP